MSHRILSIGSRIALLALGTLIAAWDWGGGREVSLLSSPTVTFAPAPATPPGDMHPSLTRN